MPQQYKIDKVSHVKECFEEASDYIFTDYRGLNVEKITEIRRELAKLESKYMVVKNNYVKVVAKEKELPDLGENVIGPTAIAFVNKDANEIAKVLFKLAKDTPLEVKGGLVGGNVLDSEEIEALSKLPGRDQLIAMLMSTMNAPLQNFVFACNDTIGQLVRVLNAVKEKKESA
ncbi:MAG: 50S ribosomal protein L10 [Spirochaetes bacterium]|nr:50S ribosomal protein L10 [Spirochaetota bacterium]